jgi:hypothetical protein
MRGKRVSAAAPTVVDVVKPLPDPANRAMEGRDPAGPRYSSQSNSRTCEVWRVQSYWEQD